MKTILVENTNWKTQVIFVIEGGVYEGIMRGYEEFHNEDELFFYLNEHSCLSRNVEDESITEICENTTFTCLDTLTKLNFSFVEKY